MIAELSPDKLRALATHRDNLCLSLFAPMDGTEPVKVTRTRLQSLLSRAEDELKEGNTDDVADELLGRVRDFIRGDLDRDAGEGLAIFVDTAGIQHHYVPWAVPLSHHVSDRFLVKPLTPAQTVDGFFVVALSHHRVRAFRAERGGIEQLELEELPKSGVDDVPGADSETNNVQHHTGKGRPGGKHPSEAMYHGHRDDSKGESEVDARLCRSTSEALRTALPQRDAPVILVAVERLAATFNHEASWMNVIAVVEGSPDEMTAEEIHDKSRPAFDRWAESDMASHAEELGAAIHNGRGSSDLEDIVVAANDGRVDTLYLDRSHTRWGRLDLAKRKIQVHDEREPGDDDLVDLAVSQTLARGGSIVPLVPEGIDADEPMVALYRHG